MDTGELETEVDGTLYHLKEKDLMIYGPGQFHTQYTDEEHGASYMTILFDMRNLTPVERESGMTPSSIGCSTTTRR